MRATLLVVDDEASIRLSLSQALIEIGYSVRCAEDGFSALRELSSAVPDLLLSDLNMPGMSGFELLSEVRRSFPANTDNRHERLLLWRRGSFRSGSGCVLPKGKQHSGTDANHGKPASNGAVCLPALDP
jgi:hypothetical protein